MSIHVCDPWLPLNHAFFQVANIFLVFSYVCPNNLKGLFMLRFCLGMSGLFFSLWAWLILCAPDTFVWNIFFFVINFLHMGYLGYTLRPVKFTKELEEVYSKVFRPLHVPRHQFKLLADEQIIEYGHLNEATSYAVEDISEFKTLSVLVSGSMDVYRGHSLLHTIHKGQFLDSPEWFASKDDENVMYRVSMVCSSKCEFISWDKDKLNAILSKNSYLQSIMDSVVGSDVSRKLFAVNLSTGIKPCTSLLTVYPVRGSLILDEYLVLRERHDIVYELQPTLSHSHILDTSSHHFKSSEISHCDNHILDQTTNELQPMLQKETVL